MTTTARYTTPDGKFHLMVEPNDDLIGFEGFAWHTHGDLVTEYRVEPPVESVPQFLEAVFADRLVIAVSRVGDRVVDVLITDDPELELKYVPEGEAVELRYWSGKKYHAV